MGINKDINLIRASKPVTMLKGMLSAAIGEARLLGLHESLQDGAEGAGL